MECEKNSYPGKWPNRFRDSWERLLQFNKTRKFNMYQDEVRVPMGDWAKSRLKNLSETDKRRDNSKVGSGFGKNISNWIGRELAYPSNVLHVATETGNKVHSAVFPKELPAWFIKLFTKPGDMVAQGCFDDPHMQELKAWSSFIHLTHRQASYHMSLLTECLLYPFKNLSLSAILPRVTEKHASFG